MKNIFKSEDGDTPWWTAKMKKWTIILSFFVAFSGLIGSANIFFGVSIRPAWSFEVQRLDDKLTSEQLELSIRLYQTERREIRRELGQRMTQQAEYIQRDEHVPTWLHNNVSNLEESIEVINESIKKETTKLLGLTKEKD